MLHLRTIPHYHNISAFTQSLRDQVDAVGNDGIEASARLGLYQLKYQPRIIVKTWHNCMLYSDQSRTEGVQPWHVREHH